MSGTARKPGARPRKAALSHVRSDGSLRMVDTSAKPSTARTATAEAMVRMAPAARRALKAGSLKKGDALAAAQVAGILAAKRTAELIPLCHPLALSHVEVSLEVVGFTVEILASAETTAQTGVEMEALTAVAVAGLAIYDMAKAIDKGMVISEIALLEKTKQDVA